MLPTPSTSHVNYSQIYEPSEDSYLLLDTLSSQAEGDFLRDKFPTTSPSPLVLEVGTGSGVVIAFVLTNATRILSRSDAIGLGIDLNRFACEATSKTAQLAAAETRKGGSEPATFLDGVVSDLTSAIRPGAVDILIFNPPYVPSETLPSNPAPADANLDAFSRDSHLLALSTDGGVDGMETTDRLLAELPLLLSNRGVAYILLCAQNKPPLVMERVRSWPGGWFVEEVGSSGNKAGWEKLSIIRIWRGHTTALPP